MFFNEIQCWMFPLKVFFPELFTFIKFAVAWPL